MDRHFVKGIFMIVRVLLSTALMTLATHPILAEETKPSYTFQYSGIKYNSVSDSKKPEGGAETKVESTTLETNGDSSYGWVTYGNWNFYLYPFTGGTYLGLSYMPNSTLEFGANFGIRNVTSDEKEDEGDESYLAPFFAYYYAMGDLTLENYLSIDLIQSKTKESSGTDLVDAESKTTGATLLVTLVYPFSKNFALVPSLSYAFANGTDKKGSVEEKTSTTTLIITPFALRTTFD